MSILRDGTKSLDERQQQITGSVAHQTLVIGGLLFFANGFVVEGTGHMWGSVFGQNLTLLYLCAIYYVAACVVRGAYFGRRFGWRRIRSFFLVFVLEVLATIILTVTPHRALLHAGRLTGNALVVIVGWGTALIYGMIIMAWVLEHRRGGKKNEN